MPTLKKRLTRKGKFHANIADKTQWNKICVDLIGPYKRCRKGKEPLILKSITMIDSATSYFEVTQ